MRLPWERRASKPSFFKSPTFAAASRRASSGYAAKEAAVSCAGNILRHLRDALALGEARIETELLQESHVRRSEPPGFFRIRRKGSGGELGGQHPTPPPRCACPGRGAHRNRASSRVPRSPQRAAGLLPDTPQRKRR